MSAADAVTLLVLLGATGLLFDGLRPCGHDETMRASDDAEDCE